MVAVWIVPECLVFFFEPRLRRFLPGPFVTFFCVVLSLIPGVIAAVVAEKAGAFPLTAKCVFVGVTAIAMTGMLRQVCSRDDSSTSRSENAEPSHALEPAAESVSNEKSSPPAP